MEPFETLTEVLETSLQETKTHRDSVVLASDSNAALVLQVEFSLAICPGTEPHQGPPKVQGASLLPVCPLVQARNHRF